MKKDIYLFDKKMNWETFKMVFDKFSTDDGPTPMHADEILFKMMQDGQINIWLDPEDKEDPIHIGKFPEVESYKLIS